MPLDRRRRSRRRPVALALVVLVIAVVLFLVIGGIAFIGPESATYRQAVDRSFADQGSVLVAQSNQSAVELRRLMSGLPAQRREQLQQTLDSLAASTASQATSAAALVPPQPAAGVGTSFATVFAQRAQAVSALRSALDGLLGLEPEPVPGSAAAGQAPTTVPGQGTALLPAARVLSDLQGVGATLTSADATYATLRRSLATSAGNAHLPRSVWVTHSSAWSTGALSTLVNQLDSSPSLAAVHSLSLLAVSINPAAVPSPTGSAVPGGVSTVPPTQTLAVGVVVKNNGNVAQYGIVVTASARTGGRSSQSSASGLNLEPGTSAATDLAPLAVSPGRTYTLTVSARSASTGGDRSGPSQTYTIAVAPNAPPPTTTPPSTTSTVAGHGGSTHPSAH